MQFLSGIGAEHGQSLSLLNAILSSNEAHKHWPLHKLSELLGDLSGKVIALWGLT